jgi:hypothetical protein
VHDFGRVSLLTSTKYMFSYYFIDNYVFVTVTVVVLLAMDFWNCRVRIRRILPAATKLVFADLSSERFWTHAGWVAVLESSG